MDKQRLIQWEAIEKAIDINLAEQRRLKETIAKQTGKRYRDVVKGSDSDHPWTPRKYVVDGVDYSQTNKHIGQLHVKEQEMQGIMAEMDEWINGIEDVEMQNILTLAYRNGMTQEEIGRELGYERGTIASKLHRFWNGERHEK